LTVDGLAQNRRHARDTWVAEEPADTRWFTDARCDFAEGVYASGYGPDRDVAVTHTRQVLFAKPHYFIIADTVHPEDEKEHAYAAVFHLDAQQVSVDTDRPAVRADYDGPQLRIVAIGDAAAQVRIVEGRREPDVQGWLPTGRHNDLRPVPTAIFSWRASGPSTMLFVLVPREEYAPWPLTHIAAPLTDPGARVAALIGQRPDGARDLFLRRPPTAEVVQVGPVSTDADVAFARIADDGSLERSFHAGGQYLRAE
jgi:hypothetical protein